MSLEELINACAENRSAADWEEFIQRFHGMIAAVVMRTASAWGYSSPDLIDDLIQETYLKICVDRKRLLSEFIPRHPEAFYGYLKVVTANVVRDYFRARHSKKRFSGQAECEIEEEVLVALDIGTVSAEESIHRSILMSEVDSFLCSCLPPKELKRVRTIFWLYYRDGLTAAAIARLPSISLTVKGVESVIHRLTRLVRERLTERDNAMSQDLEGEGIRRQKTF
jgi:RNA polymerase sigma-70 factor, ECF subfamily